MRSKKILKALEEGKNNLEQQILNEATPNIKWLFSQYVNMRNEIEKILLGKKN